MALTKTPIELSSTPGIVDNSNATAITIDASENVGIGTISPSSQLEIDESGSGDATIKVGNAQNVQTTNVGKQGATAYGATAAGAAFLYTYDNDISIMSDGAAGSIKFTTGGNTQKMVLDASGNVLVGKTSTGINTAGHELFASGEVFHSVAGTPLYVNRIGSEGPIQNFYKDGAAVGSIGVDYSTEFYMGGGGGGFYINSASIRPTTGGGASTLSDNTHDFGSASHRFKDIYLSGGVNFSANANAGGMTSETLDDYEEGTWTLASTTSGVTISTQSCRYTKVGRLVTLNGAVTFSALPSNISTQHFSGAPFNCWAQHSVGIVREATSTGTAYILQINANNSTLGMNSYSGVANGSARIFAVNESYIFSLTYTIA